MKIPTRLKIKKICEEEKTVSFPGNKSNNKFVFHKGSYKSQCAYMLMLIRQKNPKDWMLLKQEFTTIKDDETYAFFEKLVAVYKGHIPASMSEDVHVEKKDVTNIISLKVKQNGLSKNENNDIDLDLEKKRTGKSVSKKVAKKKTVKKVVKKAAVKKTAKKVAKKKVVKKTAKKVTKKKSTKKTVAKKTNKKLTKKATLPKKSVKKVAKKTIRKKAA